MCLIKISKNLHKCSVGVKQNKTKQKNPQNCKSDSSNLITANIEILMDPHNQRVH